MVARPRYVAKPVVDLLAFFFLVGGPQCASNMRRAAISKPFADDLLALLSSV